MSRIIVHNHLAKDAERRDPSWNQPFEIYVQYQLPGQSKTGTAADWKSKTYQIMAPSFSDAISKASKKFKQEVPSAINADVYG